MAAGYRWSVEWIARNDEAGGREALDVEIVSGMLTVCLVADQFEKNVVKVAGDVVRKRKQIAKAEAASQK